MVEHGRWYGETYFRHWQTEEAIPVSDAHFMIRDSATGRVLGMGTITRDISDARRTAAEREQLLAREQLARRQAETANEQLHESEERFRLTIDEAPIGMALVALDGRFVRVNRALCEIVGYSADELTGLTFQAITHPDDVDADLALRGQLARGEIPRYQLGKRYIRKDGAIVDIQLSGSMLRSREGAPLYYIAQVEDITDRKRAEAALKDSERRLTLALDSAQMGMWDLDLLTDTSVRSLRHDQIFGYSAAVPTWGVAVFMTHVVPKIETLRNTL
jgi:PAS domain S-box-containing protein